MDYSTVMPIWKELSAEECWAAIEGHEDVLQPEAAKFEVFYRAHKCPRCKTQLQKELDAHHAFSNPDVMVPRALLRCANCQYLIDPHTNMVLMYGDASKIPIESYPELDTKG